MCHYEIKVNLLTGKKGMKIFTQKYDSESIVDLDRDITESFDSVFNPIMKEIPKDEYGFHIGTFTVTVTWTQGTM